MMKMVQVFEVGCVGGFIVGECDGVIQVVLGGWVVVIGCLIGQILGLYKCCQFY